MTSTQLSMASASATLSALTSENKKLEYLIDREELLRLKDLKIIDKKFYTYLALKLTYPSPNPQVNLESFCEQWLMTESDLLAALASLQKKQVLNNTASYVQLELL